MTKLLNLNGTYIMTTRNCHLLVKVLFYFYSKPTPNHNIGGSTKFIALENKYNLEKKNISPISLIHMVLYLLYHLYAPIQPLNQS
jgi:hypothetical protein